MAKILLVEDDPSTLEAVSDSLEFEHHVVEKVVSGLEAADRLRLYQYDLAILDWGLPGKPGVQVCREYRQSGGKTPILMLTGKSEVGDRVEGLDAGADDYLGKPFNMRELSARVRALLRRPEGLISETISVRGLTLDLKEWRVTRDGREIALLAKELAVLSHLMRHMGQVFSVDDLLNKVWHSESDSGEDAVRQCITRLRKKIDLDGEESIVTTVKGLGYKIEA